MPSGIDFISYFLRMLLFCCFSYSFCCCLIYAVRSLILSIRRLFFTMLEIVSAASGILAPLKWSSLTGSAEGLSSLLFIESTVWVTTFSAMALSAVMCSVLNCLES